LLERYNYLHEQAFRNKILKLPKQETTIPIEDLVHHLQQVLSLPAAALFEFRLKTKLVNNWSDYLIFKELYKESYPHLPFVLQQSFLFYCINDVVDFNSKLPLTISFLQLAMFENMTF